MGWEIYNFFFENRVGVDGVDNLFGASVFLRLTFLTTTPPPSLAGSRVRDVEEPYLEFFSINFFYRNINLP